MANLNLWRPMKNPFREIARMESALDRMFAETSFSFTPSCEVLEDEKEYVMKFDLPGIPKEQVRIELADNQLTVTADRKEEKRQDTKRAHLEEFNYGSYMRTLALPVAIDEKKVDAKFENGVLTVTVQKAEPSKTKQIDIH